MKAKKVAGTSFEICLSKFCDDRCIITPITPVDEETRSRLGFRGAQNYFLECPDSGALQECFNHMPASLVRRLVSDTIWCGFRKIAIVRSPFEVLVSKYFFRKVQTSFSAFVYRLGDMVNENEVIAPLDGADRLNVYLRYEHLIEDLEKNQLNFLIDGMRQVRAKANIRPPEASVRNMFLGDPELVRFVEHRCANTIAKFGYRVE